MGCGSIVRQAHLPAYRKFGYRVVACCDIFEENARSLAAEFEIPFATANLNAFLALPEVEIVDLAVHAAHRRPLVERIAAAGKHILSQKPFATTLDDAQRMVEACQTAGVKLMVNQQARWSPAHQALKVLLNRGVLGHVYSFTHFHRSFQDYAGSWYAAMKDFNIIDHGIHYIDLTRHFTGRTPLRVKATTPMMPGQQAVSPMIYTILCEYEPAAHLMCTLHFNNVVSTRPLHCHEWYLDGTEGSAVLRDVWQGGDISVSFRDTPEQVQVFTVEGRWTPDGFGGSMAEMMRAIDEEREPLTSGSDNLQTMRIALAAVESANGGHTVELSNLNAGSI